MRTILVSFLILVGSCATPPGNTMNPRPQGSEHVMTCLTPDGRVFHTGLNEAVKNGLICDHAGMGEG